MASTSTVRAKVEPVLSEEFRALLGAATNDTLEKVNAGAQLVHALYNCPADVVQALPDHVGRALARAYRAYGVGGITIGDLI